MNGTCCALAALFLLACSAPAPADIPVPVRRQESRVVAPVVIRHGAIRGEGRSVQAKIVVPRSLLAGGDGGDHIRPKRSGTGTFIPPPPSPNEEARSHLPPYGTVVAGLAMSLAAVSLVFVVRGNRIAKTAALVVLSGALVVAGYGIAEADIAPGPRPNRPLPAPAPAPALRADGGEIIIELTDNGDTVTLQLAQ